MRFDPITVQDKLGRDVIIRSAEVSDAEDLIRYLKVTAGETPYLMREPEEITMTLENEQEFLQSKSDDEREVLLVATVDGKHAGNCALVSMGDYLRYAHRCVVAIALYEEYTGCGIGRMLLESVLSVAKDVGYEQAELDVMEGNENAKALYEKMGFVEYGRFPDNMKYADGTYRDAYWMMKKL